MFRILLDLNAGNKTISKLIFDFFSRRWNWTHFSYPLNAETLFQPTIPQTPPHPTHTYIHTTLP